METNEGWNLIWCKNDFLWWNQKNGGRKIGGRIKNSRIEGRLLEQRLKEEINIKKIRDRKNCSIN